MYNKVDTKLNFVEKEEEVVKFWKENKIFEQSIEKRQEGEVFTFFDGPPTANGMPHIGHVLTRAVKDIIPRYKTMKGYKVLRKAGWDTHGLPVELEVEKKLNISGKPEIEDYGVEPFIKECKESVWKYEQEWRLMSDRVGFWADMDDPYVTYHNNYIESVWWAIKKISDKGLLYKGHRVVPYCPRCGTALSSHEVAQGYKDVKDETAVAKFKVANEENTYFLAWTTTPWTLPSNVGLVVNPKETYVKVSALGEKYILAEALCEKTFGEEEFTVLEKYVGQDLENTKYEPLFDYVDTKGKGYIVCCDDYVTLTDGTGIVHCAPAFGEDDNRVGRKYDLPFVQLVNDEGNFTADAGEFAGMFVKDADKPILKDLRESGKLFKSEKYEHSYPHCWRCDTPLIYYARESWFIEMTKVRDQLVKNNNTVNWMPDNIKEGRFGNFLENVIDWSLSRERYWGTPLPVWECGCGHRHTIGSIEELKAMSNDCPDEIELHKPYVDNVHLNCPECSGQMTRVSEVIDCWFDSGSMPFAQWHYPFENKEIFEQNFPANFISEAVDQTRGWFYTLMAISTLLFDEAPYENVVVLGHVQDKNGIKMSKHKGNVISPNEAINANGADAVRWYFYSNSAPWLPSRFSEDAVAEGQRRFMGTMWNTYAFYVLYANIDNFNPLDHKLDHSSLNEMDRWLFSKLNSLTKFVDEGLDEYKLTETSRALTDFVDMLSNWYVRRSRERFWAKGMEQDKINAYLTLYEALTTLIKLSAPYIPFMTEEIYSNLVVNVNPNAEKSIHLCDYPTFDEKLIDLELEKNMDLVLDVVALGRASRNEANIKNRQPIGKMLVASQSVLEGGYLDIIKEELNTKLVEFVTSASGYTSYLFKPQLRTLGKKYGKYVPKIGEYLRGNDGEELMDRLKAGSIKFTIEDVEIELFEEDVLIETKQKEGFMAQSNNGVTVILDTTLTEDLIEEGYVREIVSKIQTMRKDAGFEVLDTITVAITGNDKLKAIIEKSETEVKEDVLCTSLGFEALDGHSKEWDINGENVTITVKKN